jgi:hypothetical protein
VRVERRTVLQPGREGRRCRAVQDRGAGGTPDCYEIFGLEKTMARTFGVFNQFERDVFTVTPHQLLRVPSAKLGFAPAS